MTEHVIRMPVSELRHGDKIEHAEDQRRIVASVKPVKRDDKELLEIRFTGGGAHYVPVDTTVNVISTKVKPVKRPRRSSEEVIVRETDETDETEQTLRAKLIRLRHRLPGFEVEFDKRPSRLNLLALRRMRELIAEVEQAICDIYCEEQGE